MSKKSSYFFVLVIVILSFIIALQKVSFASSSITFSPTPTLTPPPSIEDFPQFITDYLNEGNNPYTLQRFLRTTWQINSDVEMRKIGKNKLVAFLVYLPSRETQSLMIFALDETGQVRKVFVPYNSPTDPGVIFKLLPEVVVNFNDLPEIVYIDTDCGAHTCSDTLNVIEWNGEEFVDLIDGNLQLPHPTYLIELGQITAVSGYVNSVGAGPQRAYTEIWKWNGEVITITDKIVGPPVARMHLVHDGDAKFEQGGINEAIKFYQQAIDDKNLPSQFVGSDEDYKKEVVKAYATFKLVVAYTVESNIAEAQKYLKQLMAENRQDTEGYLFVSLGQAFWDNYSQTNDVNLACETVVTLAKATADIPFVLEIGYQNPIYEAEDICRLPATSK